MKSSYLPLNNAEIVIRVAGDKQAEAGRASRLGRVIAPPGQDEADIAQGRERVVAFGRAFGEIRQLVRDPRQQSAKLDPRQAHQFG